jgi:hypothetical protein
MAGKVSMTLPTASTTMRATAIRRAGKGCRNARRRRAAFRDKPPDACDGYG